jgi:histone H1/5
MTAKKESVEKKPAAKKVAAKKTAVKKIEKKPATKKPAKTATKPSVKKPAKARKPRAQKLPAGFTELLKKQSEFESAKKKAKTGLARQYAKKMEEALAVKTQYRKLFGESLESAQKTKGARKAIGTKPFSLDELKSFLSQYPESKEVKIVGRRPRSIQKLIKAYSQSKSKDAESILAVANK